MCSSNTGLIAQGTPATLMLREFGEFLDLVQQSDLDSKVCSIVVKMIEEMSKSYQNTTSNKKRGSEKERARIFWKQLMELIMHLLGPEVVPTIEPSSANLVGLMKCFIHLSLESFIAYMDIFYVNDAGEQGRDRWGH